ncbi:chloramphenicol 3-O-phosphotransferase [Caulobacter ginsengisoli]|uniref:Chloramphenicol 3-O-phosphotransferase n=1 Tax=Caulobacter ginsengisoli TaxID=400775 RepID=A0ABU0ISA5_9CAUL|nr:shikimate kinase [Caulobacter ginsengisoli]MDQ0463904.1 chloramphenicol 3-O-phosphotransferase [Caulobacter ginsengisoli]
MRLVFLYGPAAVGKLTVGKALSQLTGWPLFHNHLTVDLVLALFPFGHPSMVRLREEIWLKAFEEGVRAGLPGMIFTFAPERTVTADFIPNTLKAVNGEVVFVELTAPIEIIEDRLDSPSRHEFRKLTSVEVLRKLRVEGALDGAAMPEPHLVLDTSRTTPDETARAIAAFLA